MCGGEGEYLKSEPLWTARFKVRFSVEYFKVKVNNFSALILKDQVTY